MEVALAIAVIAVVLLGHAWRRRSWRSRQTAVDGRDVARAESGRAPPARASRVLGRLRGWVVAPTHKQPRIGSRIEQYVDHRRERPRIEILPPEAEGPTFDQTFQELIEQLERDFDEFERSELEYDAARQWNHCNCAESMVDIDMDPDPHDRHLRVCRARRCSKCGFEVVIYSMFPMEPTNARTDSTHATPDSPRGLSPPR
jgi:hypothetical protein